MVRWCWRSSNRFVSSSSSEDVCVCGSCRAGVSANLGAVNGKEISLVDQSFDILFVAVVVSSPRLSSNWYKYVSGAVVGFCNEFVMLLLLGTGYQICCVGSLMVSIGGKSPPHLK